MDSARHVMGCRLTQETKVQIALDDVANVIHQSLARGAEGGVGAAGSGCVDVVGRFRLNPC